MATDAPFDAEEVVWQYRFAHEMGNKAEAKRLRGVWAEWQGEDSLHEMGLRRTDRATGRRRAHLAAHDRAEL